MNVDTVSNLYHVTYFFFRFDDPTNDFPEHIHYRKDKNILPILILADPGWLILAKKPGIILKGIHGYDPIHKSMHTIFFAKGPAFKKGKTLKAFESVNVVPLLAHLLGIEAKPNNGSLNIFKDVLNHYN